jgi:hypothetical protein
MPRKALCKVFVSYSRHDEALIKPLARLLCAASDDAVFLDINSIKPGDLWKTEIEAAVRDSSVFILCWCCQSQKSDFVAHEMRIALRDKSKRLVPVLLCSTPVPPSFSKRQWIDLRGRIVHNCNDHPRPNESRADFGLEPESDGPNESGQQYDFKHADINTGMEAFLASVLEKIATDYFERLVTR